MQYEQSRSRTVNNDLVFWAAMREWARNAVEIEAVPDWSSARASVDVMGQAALAPLSPVLGTPRILAVDDEPTNTLLLQRLLEGQGFGGVVTLNDPTQVIPTCNEISPDLVLLDISMPILDGFEVMELLRPWLEGSTPVPVIVLTADTTAATKRRALAAGARDFLTKPFDLEEVRLRVSNLLETRKLELELKAQRDELEQRVLERTRELEKARLEVIERLAMAAEYRDDATHEHAQRIGETSARLAAIMDEPDAEVEAIRRAAPLHDVGKIAIPDDVLLKPGPLTDDEHATMKGHTVIGARILSGGETQLLREAEEIALNHHERWDGHGYPNGLAGEAIPLPARIVAVADVFDALTHERPYKAAWTIEDAVNEISEQSGRQFDPAVVDAFLTIERCVSSSARGRA
jgi:putative two-component system response regulator